VSASRSKPRSFAASSSFVLAGQIVGNAGFFVAVLILARVLGPSGRGAVAFLTVSALIVSGVVTVGVPSATVVLVPQRAEHRQTLLANLLAYTSVACLLGGVAWFGTLLAVPSLRPSGVEPVVLVLFVGATIFAGLVDAGMSFLVASRRTTALAAIIAVGPWSYAIVLAALDVTVGLSVTKAGIAWVTAYGIWASMLVITNIRWSGLSAPSLPLLRETIRFGTRAWASGTSRFLSFRIDQIMMPYLATETSLGLYAVGVNVSEILFYLPAAVGTLLVPRVAATAAADRLPSTLAAHRMTILITTMSTMAAAILGPLLIVPVFGDGYKRAIVPFLLLLPGAIGFALTRIFGNALMGSSMPGRSSIEALVVLVTGIVFDLLLIPPFAARGAAAAASIALIVGGATAVALYRQTEPFPLKSLLPGRAEVVRLLAIVRQVGARARGTLKGF
jgi:O-antigen/teichoic acid export membrane protein